MRVGRNNVWPNPFWSKAFVISLLGCRNRTTGDGSRRYCKINTKPGQVRLPDSLWLRYCSAFLRTRTDVLTRYVTKCVDSFRSDQTSCRQLSLTLMRNLIETGPPHSCQCFLFCLNKMGMTSQHHQAVAIFTYLQCKVFYIQFLWAEKLFLLYERLNLKCFVYSLLYYLHLYSVCSIFITTLSLFFGFLFAKYRLLCRFIIFIFNFRIFYIFIVKCPNHNFKMFFNSQQFFSYITSHFPFCWNSLLLFSM